MAAPEFLSDAVTEKFEAFPEARHDRVCSNCTR